LLRERSSDPSLAPTIATVACLAVPTPGSEIPIAPAGPRPPARGGAVSRRLSHIAIPIETGPPTPQRPCDEHATPAAPR
jgi:hypothetical protein